MRNILPIFGRSPFRPLRQHMDKVQETLGHLRPFFEAFLADDRETARELRKSIMKLEHEADLIKNDIRDHLPRSYFMPVDRRDLLGLLHQQDTVADLCEDIVIVATLRERLPLPEDVRERFLGLVDEAVETCLQASRLDEELDKLLSSSFGGPEADNVVEMINEISQHEFEVDKAAYTLAQELYRREDIMGPTVLLLWQKLIELVGRLANAAEAIGDQIRLMLYR